MSDSKPQIQEDQRAPRRKNAKREKERRGVGKMGKGAREKGRDRGRENKCLRLICYAYSRWQSSPVSLSGESHGKIIPRIEGPGRLQSMGL